MALSFSQFFTPTATPAKTQVAKPNQNTTIPTDKTQLNTDQNANNPAAFPIVPATDDKTKSPLSGFANLWENDGKNNSGTQDQPLFNVDPAKLLESAKTINFAGSIPAELATKALGGDVQAFSQAINAVTQTAYAHAVFASTQMIEEALKRHTSKFTKMFPGMVRQVMLRDSTASNKNPVFSNPATAPLLKGLMQQMAQKHPTASTAQLQDMAETYLGEFIELAGGTTKVSADKTNAANLRGNRKQADQDWGVYFDEPTEQSNTNVQL